MWKSSSNSGLAPMCAIARWPSAIRWSVARRATATSSTVRVVETRVRPADRDDRKTDLEEPPGLLLAELDRDRDDAVHALPAQERVEDLAALRLVGRDVVQRDVVARGAAARWPCRSAPSRRTTGRGTARGRRCCACARRRDSTPPPRRRSRGSWPPPRRGRGWGPRRCRARSARARPSRSTRPPRGRPRRC